MFEGFQFTDLSYFLILALIPGIVETAKKWEWVDARLYSEVDRAALAMYCQAWDRWVEADKRLGETGGPILTSA